MPLTAGSGLLYPALIACSISTRTQLQLSEMIDVSPPYMSYIENGIKCAGIETLVKVANALQISTDELLGDNLNEKLAASVQTVIVLLSDCSDYERRVLLDTLTALKGTLVENRDSALSENKPKP